VPEFSVFGEANARVVAVRADPNQSSPSIEQVFNNGTAPGLASQPAFAQLGEGVRFAPTLARGYLRLSYALTLQQYVPGAAPYSFQRLTMDFNHQIPIYKTTRTLLPKAGNGPDDCSDNPSSTIAKCPGISRNKEGSVSLRLLMIDSLTSGGNVVPFYFQPTLGGSDHQWEYGIAELPRLSVPGSECAAGASHVRAFDLGAARLDFHDR
jgi:hypothetical protein